MKVAIIRWLALLLLALPSPALACTLCLNIKATPTLRSDANGEGARLILYGHISASTLKGTTGSSTFVVDEVLQVDPKLEAKFLKKKGDTLEIQQYLGVSDAKNPPRFLLYCDVFKERYDPYRGIPMSTAAIDYFKGARALDPKDAQTALLYFAKYLEHSDKEIAKDAFLEFAKAPDAEIGKLAGKLDAAKLRTWIKDENTPVERLGLYAFLLAGCGKPEDTATFKTILDNPPERMRSAYDGILTGYIHLTGKDGWASIQKMLGDSKTPLPHRMAAVRTLQFFHGWDAKTYREPILKALGNILQEGDLSDLAIDFLRRWQEWEHTPAVLATWGRKGLDAPVMQRAILRYALSCPKDEAKKFVVERKKDVPDIVKEVEESLQYEKDVPR